MKLQDITGKKFGRYTVLEKVGYSKGATYWFCKCECGAERNVAGNNLKSGISKSCGCLSADLASTRNSSHGQTRGGKISRTYKSWALMKSRCLNAKAFHAKYYKEKCVKVCKRWIDSFENFLSDMGERPVGKTLDRKNAEGNYEPGNCRWATQKEQCRNKLNSVMTPEGICLSEYAEKHGVNYKTLHHLHRKLGWPLTAALERCLRKHWR